MASTDKYGLFKTLVGNRGTDAHHVERLAKAIEKKNLLEEFPIIVNEQFEIIDGQHRLMAAAQLGVPVHYKIVRHMDLANTMDINTASKSWGVKDFVNSYVTLENSHYIALKEFAEEFGVSYTIAANLLLGKASDGGHIAETLRNGSFQIQSSHRARKVAEALSRVAPYTDFKAKSNRTFIAALNLLMDNEDFDIDRLIGKLKNNGQLIHIRQNLRYYIIHIEEIYNFNVKTAENKVDLYLGQV